MQKIIDVRNIQPKEGYDKYITAILNYNRKNNTNFNWLLPDLTKSYNYSNFADYFKIMERLDGTDEFIKFVKENKNQPSICISDHDCDGIMACVICSVGLYEYGVNISHISTDRFKTGYGMKKEMIDEAYESGARVIYTVDQGITCNDVIDYAHSKGMKVCVTDHHNGPFKCNADCIVNPCYFANQTKFKTISGATVILKLIYELYKSDNLEFSLMNDLAALAGFTVLSDVMPLINENRILYKSLINYCNSAIYSRENNYIRRISDLLSFYIGNKSYEFVEMPPVKNFNKTTIDFYFVPVINALNRVQGDVKELINDLILLFYDYSSTPADTYSKINHERKQMKKELFLDHVYDEYSVCVEAFNTNPLTNYSGICGLVASDVVENEKRPALIGIKGEKLIKFSGRSVPGYSLYELLKKVKADHPELNLEFGGHAEALGASIPVENLDLFREIVSEYFSNDRYEVIDEYFLLDNADNWMRVFKKYAPFGNKFELPRFYAKTTVHFCNFDRKTFSLKNCGRSEIRCYGRADLEYVMELAARNRSKEMECILEIITDENGNSEFKLVNILNKDSKFVF